MNSKPRWPAAASLVATVGFLNMVLPERLSAGPFWLLMAIVAVLLVPVVVTHHTGRERTNQALGYVLLSVVTTFLISTRLSSWCSP